MGRPLQPPTAVAAALERADGREGGVLVVAPPESSGDVTALGAELGVEGALWGNGTTRGEGGPRRRSRRSLSNTSWTAGARPASATCASSFRTCTARAV